MAFLAPKGLNLKPVKTGNDFADAILSLILPMTLEEQVTGLASPMSFLGMAGKKFLPGPQTLEGLITRMAKSGEVFPARHKLLPAIKRTQTGEIFTGEVGGQHPVSIMDTLSRIQGPRFTGKHEFGFQMPGEKPFVPDILANYLQKPGNAKIVHELLQRGSSIDSIIDILKKGRLE